MSYVVLARRWRSQHFDEVVGQEHVARTLCNAIEQDRVAHAFLFCGPRGVGKTSTARILAKALNCAQGPTTKPCYNCASCNEISDGCSMDVFEIDGASNRGVNEIRELRDSVRYAPSRDRHKIYIIDEVHMLTTEAFNALLKTLEEPPPHVKFIFATTEPQKIPVTILSRCQRFDFKRINARRITEHLAQITEAEKIEAETGALNLIARQADGCMRDALSLTDQVISFCEGKLSEAQVAQVLGVAGRDVLFELTAALFQRQVEHALRVLDRVNSAGFDLMHFTSALVEHLRDLTVIKVSQNPQGLIDLTDDEIVLAKQQLEYIDISVLNRMFNICVQAAESMTRSAYPKLVFEMTLVKLSAIEPLMPLELLLKRLEAIESGTLIGPGTGGAPPTTGSGGPPPGQHNNSNSAAASGQAPYKAQAPAFQPAEAKPQAVPVAPTIPDEVPATIIPLHASNLPPRPENLKEEGDIALPAPPQHAAPSETAPNSNTEPPINGHAVNGTEHNGSNHLRLIPAGQKVEVEVEAIVEAKPEPTKPEPIVVEPPKPEPLPTFSAEEENDRDLWRSVVDHLRAAGKQIPAGIYSQARILKVDRETNVLTLGFDQGLDSMADANLSVIEQATCAALGSTDWTIELDYEGDTGVGQRSLAQEQDEIHRANLDEARGLIATNDLVTQAINIFSPEKTWVVLDEDDHITSLR